MSAHLAEFSDAVRELVRHHKLVAAGFVALQRMAAPPDAPPEQINDMRIAFFAGAFHMFTSLTEMMDPATDCDVTLVAEVKREMDAFAAEFALRYGKPHGVA